MNKVLEHIYNKWTPHKAQQKFGKAFLKGYKDLFCQWGRKGGKTEFVLWCMWQHASVTPNAVIYYVCPDIRKAERILWHNKRVMNFGPSWFIKNIDKENKIIEFTNDAHIQILSSRDHGNASGLTPTLIILDEISDHNENFYREFEPNRAVHHCQAVFIGTPPLYYSKNKEQYYRIRQSVIDSPDGLFLRASSYENPHNSKKFLDGIRREMEERGEKELFEIQYLAKDSLFVENQLFPMITDSVLLENADLRAHIGKDYRHLDWYGAIKPAVESKTGMLLAGINPRNGNIYVFYTHIEDRPNLNSTSKLVPQIKRMSVFCNMDNIFISCTPKCDWFSTDLAQNHDLHCIPCDLTAIKNGNGISMIRDLLLNHKIYISKDAEDTLYKELYVANIDDSGKANEKAFLLIDCLRYIISVSGYTSIGQQVYDGPSLPKDLFDLID